MNTTYQTLIVKFSEPITALDGIFDDTGAWGTDTLKGWIDDYESTRFTATDSHTAVITSEYNMECVKEWLQRQTRICENFAHRQNALSAESGYDNFFLHIAQIFLRSPNGYFSNICSVIHLLESTGESFQPELQVETISTTDVPFLSRLFWKACLMAAFALRTAAGECTLWRVT